MEHTIRLNQGRRTVKERGRTFEENPKLTRRRCNLRSARMKVFVPRFQKVQYVHTISCLHETHFRGNVKEMENGQLYKINSTFPNHSRCLMFHIHVSLIRCVIGTGIGKVYDVLILGNNDLS
uniref:Uncharacterized protein n=2 Tax=Cacopsylla melanoneura TaxID=428564 RepID=A0A8D8W322_9HEMI